MCCFLFSFTAMYMGYVVGVELIKEGYYPTGYEDEMFSYKAHALTTQSGSDFGPPYGFTFRLFPKNKSIFNCKVNIEDYKIISRKDGSLLSSGKDEDMVIDKTKKFFMFSIRRELLTNGHDIKAWLLVSSSNCMIGKEIEFDLEFYKKVEKMDLWNRIRYAT